MALLPMEQTWTNVYDIFIRTRRRKKIGGGEEWSFEQEMIIRMTAIKPLPSCINTRTPLGWPTS